MVFSSLVFLLVFLPIVVFLYHILTKWFNGRLAILSLFIASLIYYAYWKVENIWIIIASIIFNYAKIEKSEKLLFSEKKIVQGHELYDYRFFLEVIKWL